MVITTQKTVERQDHLSLRPNISTLFSVFQGYFRAIMLGELLIKTAHSGQVPQEPFAWVGLWQEVLVRNMELTGHHQPEVDASPHVLPTSQNPSRWNPSWLSNACLTRKDPESEWLGRDNLQTKAINIKPEAVSHMAGQFSWVPLPSYSPRSGPFSINSLALLACVSPGRIHFWVLDKSPLSGPFLQQCEHWTVT